MYIQERNNWVHSDGMSPSLLHYLKRQSAGKVCLGNLSTSEAELVVH